MVGFYKTLKPEEAISKLTEISVELKRRHHNLNPDTGCELDLQKYVHFHIHQGLTMRSTKNPEHDAAQFKRDLLEFFDEHAQSIKQTVIQIIEDQTTSTIDQAHQVAKEYNEFLSYGNRDSIPPNLFNAERKYREMNLRESIHARSDDIARIIYKSGCSEKYINFMRQKDPEFDDFMKFYDQNLKPIRTRIKDQLLSCADQIDDVIGDAKKYEDQHTNHPNQRVFAQTLTELALHYTKIEDAFSLLNNGSSATWTDTRSDYNDYKWMEDGYVRRLVTPDAISGTKYVPPSAKVCARIAGLRKPSPEESTQTLTGNFMLRSCTKMHLVINKIIMERYRDIPDEHELYPSFEAALNRVCSKNDRPLARMASALRTHQIM